MTMTIKQANVLLEVEAARIAADKACADWDQRIKSTFGESIEVRRTRQALRAAMETALAAQKAAEVRAQESAGRLWRCRLEEARGVIARGADVPVMSTTDMIAASADELAHARAALRDAEAALAAAVRAHRPRSGLRDSVDHARLIEAIAMDQVVGAVGRAHPFQGSRFVGVPYGRQLRRDALVQQVEAEVVAAERRAVATLDRAALAEVATRTPVAPAQKRRAM
ncbi:hypothetical protein [Dyella psychrodurans]|uniref:Uncharacterized protein n=1 Tax=Dyella psychrodurans TaxID=1927960 RepID=A0A370XC96_9GAMM|nr:hypothetical protein [Dyella psychrodurans]RDS85907.1 hypothetical protein DWU99_01115 [Dyella psychrodurans]